MDSLIRFSGLVRKGLRFRQEFDGAKRLVSTPDFEWYPYDCFANLFYVQRLLNTSGLSLDAVCGAEPVLDLGAADGALSFFMESLGYQVHAVDHAGTNLNRMAGIRSLAQVLRSAIHIHDIDLDARFEFAEECGAALFLGTLYHMKNPFYILELLAKRMRFCFLSTRVARLTADRRVRLEEAPVAFLVEPDACNSDVTNYWIFSPAGLLLLVKRAGWTVLATANSGARESDPVTKEGDERMFLLLQSNLL